MLVDIFFGAILVLVLITGIALVFLVIGAGMKAQSMDRFCNEISVGALKPVSNQSPEETRSCSESS